MRVPDEAGGERALLIAGPTASGKSALAAAAAARLGGVVINADAMQVYAGLAILTAQPGGDERAAAPHLLFGHRDAAAPSSVGVWLGEVRSALVEAAAAGRRPVLVGGTGLYFKALTQGLSAIPPVPEAVRAAVRREADEVPATELHRRLAALDPVGAGRLRPSDPQRILRALEVLRATGRPLASFQGAREPPLLPPERIAAFFILPERTMLVGRIEARFEAMMAAGALAEVAALRARGLDPALPALRALGVPPLLRHLEGTLALPDAVTLAKAQTRAYARRQVTFGRHQLPAFRTVPPEAAAAAIRAMLG